MSKFYEYYIWHVINESGLAHCALLISNNDIEIAGYYTRSNKTTVDL